MRKRYFGIVLLILALFGAGVFFKGSVPPLLVPPQQPPVHAAVSGKEKVSPAVPGKALTALPSLESPLRDISLPFIANKGQVDKRVKYYAQTFGGTLFVTEGGELVYALPGRKGREVGEKRGKETQPVGIVALREHIVGAEVREIRGEGETAIKVNYFKGNDPSGWRTGIPAYASVTFGEVYEGIELKLKAQGNNVEKLFHLKPGANPGSIALQIRGASSLMVNRAGELEAETEEGTVKFTRPVAFQDTEGGRKHVEIAYAVSGDTYRFAVGDYDRTKELVIDPLLASTFLGGGRGDFVKALQLDSSGNVYLAGYTLSANFPIMAMDSGIIRPESAYYDVFVAKLDGDLTTLLASSILGGDRNDQANTLALDSSGNVLIAGHTNSAEYPVPEGSYDATRNEPRRASTNDAFITKLDGDLSSLLSSTLLGGSSDESITALALDPSGNIFVSGHTESSDFPVTGEAFSPSLAGYRDAFVAKLDSDLTTLLASTFLGGGEEDYGRSLAIDAAGMPYLAGDTSSSDFPVTGGTFSSTYGGNNDAFVAHFDNDLTTLQASTFLGGERSEYCYSLALSASGEVYLTGTTGSSDYPVTPGAFSPSLSSSGYYPYEAFVSKLDSDLTTLLASTFLGGSGETQGYALVPDPTGGVYVTGYTTSADFPVTEGTFDTSRNGYSDVFIAKFDSNLATLHAATFLGGSSEEYGRSLALDASGDVYVAGETYSRNYPVTKGALGTSLQGANDIFVSRLDSALSEDFTLPESCTYHLVVLNGTMSGAGGTGQVSVTASSGKCSWTAESATEWISITDGGGGTGDGTVFFAVGANPDPIPRKGTLSIAGRTVIVTQKGAIPHLSVPSLVSFGAVEAGESSTQEVTIRNTGTGSLVISRISVLGKGFDREESTCETEAIAPDSVCTVTIRFTPASRGNFRGRLALESDDPDSPLSGVLLTGRGTQSEEEESRVTSPDLPLF